MCFVVENGINAESMHDKITPVAMQRHWLYTWPNILSACPRIEFENLMYNSKWYWSWLGHQACPSHNITLTDNCCVHSDLFLGRSWGANSWISFCAWQVSSKQWGLALLHWDLFMVMFKHLLIHLIFLFFKPFYPTWGIDLSGPLSTLFCPLLL